MAPVKVQFIIENSYTNVDVNSSEASSFINNMIMESWREVKDGYDKHASSVLLPKYKEAIIRKLEIDSNIDIEFSDDIDQDLYLFVTPINALPPFDSGHFTWKLNFKLSSGIYTCIQILTDKTFICHTDTNKELKFIKLINNRLKAVIV